jgi:hypothetical protein
MKTLLFILYHQCCVWWKKKKNLVVLYIRTSIVHLVMFKTFIYLPTQKKKKKKEEVYLLLFNFFVHIYILYYILFLFANSFLYTSKKLWSPMSAINFFIAI